MESIDKAQPTAVMEKTHNPKDTLLQVETNNLKIFTILLIIISEFPLNFAVPSENGEVPEWPKGTVC